MSVFSERLKELRNDSKLTQGNLAEVLHLGGKQQIFNYEKGLSEPSIDILNQIAKHFNVSVDYLTGNSDYPNPNYAQIEGMGIESKTVDKLMKVKVLFEDPGYSQDFEELVNRTNSLINSLNSGIQEVSNLRIPADAYYDFGYTTLEDETEQIITEITGILRRIRRNGLKNIFQILKKPLHKAEKSIDE